jgi:hypothetical protein
MLSGIARSFALWETGSIQHHHDEVPRMGLADLGQELGHARRVHFPAHPPIQFARERADGPVNVDKLALVAIAYDRAQRDGCPAALGAHRPPETRFVLKHQAHGTALDGFGRQLGSQRFGREVRMAGLEDVPAFLEIIYPFELADEVVLKSIATSVRHCLHEYATIS